MAQLQAHQQIPLLARTSGHSSPACSTGTVHSSSSSGALSKPQLRVRVWCRLPLAQSGHCHCHCGRVPSQQLHQQPAAPCLAGPGPYYLLTHPSSISIACRRSRYPRARRPAATAGAQRHASQPAAAAARRPPPSHSTSTCTCSVLSPPLWAEVMAVSMPPSAGTKMR